MYWLDGSSELPYTPKSSYLLSKTRTRAIALAQDLIENQARIVKSYVKYNNFHHWCTEASELVDLMIDLVRRDEKYLLRDGLSIPKESLSNLDTEITICESRVRFDIRKHDSALLPEISYFGSASNSLIEFFDHHHLVSHHPHTLLYHV